MFDKILNRPKKALTMEEWAAWKTQAKQAHPFIYWLQDDFYYFFMVPIWRLKNFYYSLRCRFIRKYYLVDTKLDRYSYYDKDTLLLHANFSLLEDFVEKELGEIFNSKKAQTRKERGLAYLDWEQTLTEDSPLQAASAKEKKELYLWWKSRTVPDILSLPEKPTKEDYEDFFKKEEESYNKDTEMLLRLIKIRNTLWS